MLKDRNRHGKVHSKKCERNSSFRHNELDSIHSTTRVYVCSCAASAHTAAACAALCTHSCAPGMFLLIYSVQSDIVCPHACIMSYTTHLHVYMYV